MTLLSYSNKLLVLEPLVFTGSCIPSLHFMSLFKSFFKMYSRTTHYFRVNCKTNHLSILDNTICQSVCKYIVEHIIFIHSIYLYIYIYIYIYIYVHAIENITIATVKQKKNGKASDDECQCQLNIFGWNKWLYHLLLRCKIVIAK